MKRKGFNIILFATIFILVSALPGITDVPAPPVNQIIGIPDTVFNNLTEADCRFCHEDPNIVGGPNNSDRHHLLYGIPLNEGFCSAYNDIIWGRNICTTASDCNANICSIAGTPCVGDLDCPVGQTCGEDCVGESIAPFPPAADGTYECTTCHPILVNGQIDVIAVRDCLFCHVQINNEASVHHFTAEAQSKNCQYCHGSLVNNIGDGHIIPEYTPSLVTPSPSFGSGFPYNSEGNGAGACDYCHSTGTGQPGAVQPGYVFDPAFTGVFGPVEVYRSSETHHSTGLGLFDNSQCLWCHNIDDPSSDPIRRCQGCHGFESLHNIAVDSDDPDQMFTPAGDPQEENPGWSHVGNNDDCWGCHGFSSSGAVSSVSQESSFGTSSYSSTAVTNLTMSTVSGMGPLVPYINSASTTVVNAGTATAISLSGISFTNFTHNMEWIATVVLTSDDGIETELPPDFVSENSLTVTIPETMGLGNYHLRAVKGDKKSNPFVISVKPDVIITEVDCNRRTNTLTITGSGFGKRPEGSDSHINVEIKGKPTQIISWTDNEIKANVRKCKKLKKSAVTVNALFGTAVSNMTDHKKFKRTRQQDHKDKDNRYDDDDEDHEEKD
jgi:hypothetical protein